MDDIPIDTNKVYDLLKREIDSLPVEWKNDIFRSLFGVIETYKHKSFMEELNALGLESQDKQLERKNLAPAEEQRYDFLLQHSEGLTAGQLAEYLNSSRNLESIYLNRLERKGWVEGKREGRFVLYRPLI